MRNDMYDIKKKWGIVKKKKKKKRRNGMKMSDKWRRKKDAGR
jgi:hypothetical protein